MTQVIAPNGSRAGRSAVRDALLLCLALCAASWPGPAFAQSGSSTRGAVIAGCQACHGAGGDSRNADIPRLNGQRIDYMLGRLDILGNTLHFAHHDDAMWRTVSGMDANIREDVVKYFAAQKPMAARPGALAARGRQIYENGDPGAGVLACSLCHGAAGEGRDLAPRIAGQHGNYLKAQIQQFNSLRRPHGTMNNDSHKLTGDEVGALVDYLGND